MKMLSIKKFFYLGMAVVLLPAAALAAGFGIDKAGEVSGLADNQLSTSGGIPVVLGSLIAVILSLVGIFFFILILISGFEWMTAQGSSEKIDQAKKRMISAAIGLVIVLSAYTISNYIFTEFLSGSTVVVDENCRDVVDGVKCEDNKVCSGGRCVEECVYVYPRSGQCGDVTACQDHIVSGLCPGPSEIKCCVSESEYSSYANSSASGASGDNVSCLDRGGLCLSGLTSCLGTVLDDNSCGSGRQCCLEECVQQGGSCTTESNCNSRGGKKLSASCGSGQVCCQTCATLGGSCQYGTQESCTANTINGVCPEVGGEQGRCCLGTSDIEGLLGN